jgi:hypothetical protein
MKTHTHLRSADGILAGMLLEVFDSDEVGCEDCIKDGEEIIL